MIFGENNVSKRPDVRRKISESKKGKPTWNKGKHLTPEWKAKISKANTGRRWSVESNLKRSASQKGKRSPVKGMHWKLSPEVRTKMIGRFAGSKHPRWIKDRTKLAKHQERNDMAYKEWRKSVCNRDNWKCRIADTNCIGKVVAHHILPWSNFPELRYEVNNGITLCHFHHPRKRNDEIKLVSTFQRLVQVKAN